MRISSLMVPVLLSILGIACAVQPATQEPEAVDSHPQPTVAALQAKIDTFAHALADRDVPALASVVSGEIVARAKLREMDLGAFLEKQRGALMRTHAIVEGERPDFLVTEAAPEGDSVRVTLQLKGVTLKKPFYFVREGDDYKLNIAPPGFSKTSPEGTLFGSSSYTVDNQSIQTAPAFIECYQGANRPLASVLVPRRSTKTISCEDSCGFWSGSTFYGAGFANPRKCDWNSWGDDVIVDDLGWHCNDGC